MEVHQQQSERRVLIQAHIIITKQSLEQLWLEVSIIPLQIYKHFATAWANFMMGQLYGGLFLADFWRGLNLLIRPAITHIKGGAPRTSLGFLPLFICLYIFHFLCFRVVLRQFYIEQIRQFKVQDFVFLNSTLSIKVCKFFLI